MKDDRQCGGSKQIDVYIECVVVVIAICGNICYIFINDTIHGFEKDKGVKAC
jgi:hypothetical protein